MSELAPLIQDLALILITAAIVTIIFRKIKQPLCKLGLGRPATGFCKNRDHWSLILGFCPRCPLGKTLLNNFHVLSFTQFCL